MKSSRYSLKPLITSLFLALGLSPLGGEAFADPVVDSSAKSSASSSVSTAPVFTGNVVQNTHYAPQLNLGGFYGINNGSYGEADVWVPLWQTASQVVYGDVRYEKTNAASWDIAVGAGYRWLSDDMDRLYDVYSFYNSYNSTYNNQFQQIMLGGAVRDMNWTLRGNYYYSIGPTQYNVNSLDNLSFVPTAGIQNYGLISYGFENNYVNGGVIEIGRTIPYSPGLSLFGGYYGFAKNEVRPFVNGFRARAEYRLEEAFDFKTPFVRHITLESMYQYDNVNDSMFTVGARLDIPLGQSYTNSKLQDAMMDYVRFYPHAIQEDISSTTPVIYTQNGAPVIFDLVRNTTDFQTAVADNSNVVVVLDNFQLAGTTTIVDNKYITGQNYEYAPGKFTNITGKSTIPTITGASGDDIFVLGSGDTIRDVTLTTTGQPASGALLNAIVNYNFGSVGNLTIDNITTNGAVSIQVADGSVNSVINITNSKFNPADVLGIQYTPTTVVDIEVGNVNGANGENAPSTVTVGSLDNNIIIFSSNAAVALNYQRAFYLYGSLAEDVARQNNNTLNITSVSGNHITFGDNVTGVGIDIDGNNNATTGQTIGHIDNNVIVFGKNASAIGNSEYTSGIVIGTNASQSVNSVSGNNITFGSGSIARNDNEGHKVELSGIYIFNTAVSPSPVQTITSVDNNTITFGDNASVSELGGGNTYLGGIYVYNYGGAGNQVQNITSIDGNSIVFSGATSASTASGSSATGILGGIIFNDNAGGITDTQNFGLTNNTVSFEGVQSGNDLVVNTYGFAIINWGGQGTQTVTAMNGNNILLSGGATNATGTICNYVGTACAVGGNPGTINITIGDASVSGNITGLSQANNNIIFFDGDGTGVNITA